MDAVPPEVLARSLAKLLLAVSSLAHGPPNGLAPIWSGR